MPRLPTPIQEAIRDLRSYAADDPARADEIQADLEDLVAALLPSPVPATPEGALEERIAAYAEELRGSATLRHIGDKLLALLASPSPRSRSGAMLPLCADPQCPWRTLGPHYDTTATQEHQSVPVFVLEPSRGDRNGDGR